MILDSNHLFKKIFGVLRLKVFSLFFVSLLSVLISVNAIVSFADDNQAAARKLSASGKILSLEKIHQKAKAIKSGKILETELEIKGSQYVYEVELLDDKGLVWEIDLDAKTGKLIKLEED